ncbi:spore germination protein KC [Caloranaerobacter azorensis DSM 13643]|uniref:Spore germination protein KC n=1 Tax=Caloranaerobacter azorensis DSM 13643 TaxID=1121264 RepID=A0A1M5UZU9_9FIRM|nr:Ger(x)C family spore germination protein [Caloranaerobacter azorensis]SHH68378.1 spore germination protein KC [Caloranaerobacter azorensis DSM 13643]
MKSTKKIVLIILLFINALNFTSCWNYKEINEVAIVGGMALDKNKENGKYIMTVEIMLPEASDGLNMRPEIYTMEGNTLFDAIRNFIAETGVKLYWSHLRVVLLSQDVAKEGIVPTLDLFMRDAELRTDVWLLISKGKTAREILEEGTAKIHDTVSFHLHDMLKTEASISKYKGVQFWDFVKTLSEEGSSPFLPTVELVDKGKEKIPKICGVAVFKKGKMVGWLDGIETRALLFIRDEIKGGVIPVKNVEDFNTDITLEIFRNETKLKPELIGGKLIMNIDVITDVGIAEIDAAKDLLRGKGRKNVKKDAEALIEKQIEKVVKKVQREYKSDIFGFSGAICRTMPNVWKSIKGDWEDVFTELDIKVNVNVRIKWSALSSKPIKIGE